MTKYEVEEKTVEYLKTVFDPEIPVNVWDLGMIYKIDVKESPHMAPSDSPKGEGEPCGVKACTMYDVRCTMDDVSFSIMHYAL